MKIESPNHSGPCARLGVFTVDHDYQRVLTYVDDVDISIVELLEEANSNQLSI